jgi:hypothetical protein
MGRTGLAAIAAALIAALGVAASAVAQEAVPPSGNIYNPPYLPGGHLYAPGEGPLPPIDSPQAQFNTRVDILQTEIYRRQFQQRLDESQMFRSDLRPGPLSNGNFFAPRF